MEEELDLLELWHILLKRWKMIILLTLLAAAISGAVSQFLLTPHYVASASLMVMKPVEAEKILYQDIQVSRQLADTYQIVVHSRRVLGKVIQALDLPFSAGELKNRVKVDAVKNTEIITIDVTDSDPYQAARISNQIARTFMDEITEIMSVDNVSLIDLAAVPTVPVSPRLKLNVAVAAVLGLMLAVGIALLQHYLDQTVKSSADIQDLLGLTVLGTIPVMEEE